MFMLLFTLALWPLRSTESQCAVQLHGTAHWSKLLGVGAQGKEHTPIFARTWLVLSMLLFRCEISWFCTALDA